METSTSFASLVVVVVVAFLMPLLLNRLRLQFVPVVVAEIVAGIIIGKTGFNFIHNDSILDTLSTLGFIYLLFLSGLEIDFSVFASKNKNKKNSQIKKKKEPNSFLLAIIIFVFILVISYVLALGIGLFGQSSNPYLMTLVIATISLGIVVPTLKDTGILKSSIGQNILLISVIGDLVTMILLAVFASLYSEQSGSIYFIVILFLAGIVFYFLGKYFKHRSFLETMTKGTIQIDIRAVFALIIVFVGLAESLGTEIILGSFLAGVLVSLLSPNPTMVHKLDSFGYGFLIPIFFVMVGVELDLRSIFTDPQVLVLIPMLLVAFYLAKLVPALFLRKWYGWRTVLSVGMLISAKLTLLIAAARVGERLGIIGAKMSSAIILVGVISSIVGPIAFKKIFPTEEHKKAKKKVVFIGANQITLPISLELDKENFETVVFHRKQEKWDRVDQMGQSTFEVRDIPDCRIETVNEVHGFDADIIILATKQDELNAELALEAQNHGVERIIARVETPDMVESLRDKGIEVYSSLLSAKTILRALIETPGLVDILTKDRSLLHEVRMNNPKYHFCKLKDFPFQGDAIIIRAFRGKDSIIPHGDTELLLGDRLIVTGSREHVAKLRELLES
ncbi:CPA2 family monovalent cation:H+ antiporter-2 [Pullulanibacillus pueri]|uniref:Putative Na(+)/H(+) antiporter YjbQ n=1 Tax=Pullulanibacillus pueri TaxID=1437324 RepID=A0A8J2ZWN2_9BACL|nr:monovalent cation:proton antiporter family protein [Pullulanibacillus pueri]MBM7680605.1 CPA2 family monovalent cation:H+ antiporter-2 [Pullulanibacillus pueri]GGH83959.1 putative Na(+)/H(+) antiporter YjbQ [Pullulanibacillus pueri]